MNAFTLLEELRAGVAVRLRRELERVPEGADEKVAEILEALGDFLVHGDRALIRDQLTRLGHELGLQPASLAVMLLGVPNAVRAELGRRIEEDEDAQDALRVLERGIHESIDAFGARLPRG